MGPVSNGDLNHSIYPYPARVIRQIPRFFVRCPQLIRAGNTVLDPFCGSGTVMVEAWTSGVASWGIDTNPFARLLTRVKTTPLDPTEALRLAQSVMQRGKTARSGLTPDVVNIDLWYSAPIRRSLSRLYRALAETPMDCEYRRYLRVCMALTAEQLSFRDLRIPVPVRRRDWAAVGAGQSTGDVWKAFGVVAARLARQLGLLQSLPSVPRIVQGTDAASASQEFDRMLPGCLDRPKMILTSPPYGAAQKYIRSTSLSLGWAGLAEAAELAQLERQTAGREHVREEELDDIEVPDESIARQLEVVRSINRRRASIYAHYFRAMDLALTDLADLLAPGGSLVLVAGSNVVAGRRMETHRHLRDLALKKGLLPVLELRDAIRGRVLFTKRASSGTPLAYETIHLLTKGRA